MLRVKSWLVITQGRINRPFLLQSDNLCRKIFSGDEALWMTDGETDDEKKFHVQGTTDNRRR